MRKRSAVLFILVAVLGACSNKDSRISATGTGTGTGAPMQPLNYDGGTDPYAYYYDGGTDPYAQSQYLQAPAGQVWVVLGQNGPGNWYWIGDATPLPSPNSICAKNPYALSGYTINPPALWLYNESTGNLDAFGCYLVRSQAPGSCDPDTFIRQLCGY